MKRMKWQIQLTLTLKIIISSFFEISYKNRCSDPPLSAYRSQQRSQNFQTVEIALLCITFFLSHGFITGEGDVINDVHDRTDVIFSTKNFSLPDLSRYPNFFASPKVERHYPSGPSWYWFLPWKFLFWHTYLFSRCLWQPRWKSL